MIADDRIDAWIAAAGVIAAAAGIPGDATLVGIGWATVDADRAAAEFEGGSDAPTWRPAERDAILGARAWIRTIEIPRVERRPGSWPPGHLGLLDGVTVALLEPDTEGRLAAFLARHAEGVAAAYVRRLARTSEAVAQARQPVARGPLGAGRLQLGGRASGPHVIVLESDDATGGTIAP